MSTPVTAGLADACPVCPPPFDRDACPATAIQGAAGGVITAHECAYCGSSWRTWRDPDGWQVERKIDPVTAEQAGVNRGVLEEAMAEHRREARHAAA